MNKNQRVSMVDAGESAEYKSSRRWAKVTKPRPFTGEQPRLKATYRPRLPKTIPELLEMRRSPALKKVKSGTVFVQQRVAPRAQLRPYRDHLFYFEEALG